MTRSDYVSDTNISNRVRDILNSSADNLTTDIVYTAIQAAKRRRDRANDDIQLLNAKFVEVAISSSEADDAWLVALPSQLQRKNDE